MKEKYFVSSKEVDWNAYEQILQEFELGKDSGEENRVQSFIQKYRAIAHDLTVARSRRYSTNLIEKLNDLVLRGHNLVYTKQAGWFNKILYYFLHTFPRTVRQQWRLVLISSLAFFGSGLLIFITIAQDPDFVYSILSPQAVAQYEQMYDPSARLIGQTSTTTTRWEMFGMYIYNNTSIGLLVFISGIVLSLGTLFVLLFNGVYIGAIVSHLSLNGFESTLLPFIVGHGSFELIAIVIAGAAGLRLGQGIFIPGEFARKTAIKIAAKEAFMLVGGFCTMFFIAAFIEAYWSAVPMSPMIKYSIGAVLWLLVLAYFVLVGRDANTRQ